MYREPSVCRRFSTNALRSAALLGRCLRCPSTVVVTLVHFFVAAARLYTTFAVPRSISLLPSFNQRSSLRWTAAFGVIRRWSCRGAYLRVYCRRAPIYCIHYTADHQFVVDFQPALFAPLDCCLRCPSSTFVESVPSSGLLSLRAFIIFGVPRTISLSSTQPTLLTSLDWCFRCPSPVLVKRATRHIVLYSIVKCFVLNNKQTVSLFWRVSKHKNIDGLRVATLVGIF